LSKVKGKMFRIGHLGDSNDLSLVATIAACEMGLQVAGVKLQGSGVHAIMHHFTANPGGLLQK
jgi:alanine-glyoxylate transaminase/serine-glyoxylate transaminase/serine-pyruvate transaminase